MDINDLAELADTLDNYYHAAELPLPPLAHLRQMRKCLHDASQTIKMFVVAHGGEDVWALNPCAHCAYKRSED